MTDIRPRNAQLTVSCRQQAAKHSEGSRLAGPVGSEQTEDGSAVHVKTDVVDCREGAELPDQAVNVYNDFIVSRGQRTIERDSRRVFLVGHATQQRHEAIFESGGCCGDLCAGESVGGRWARGGPCGGSPGGGAACSRPAGPSRGGSPGPFG